jgi:hypothetical protein
MVINFSEALLATAVPSGTAVQFTDPNTQANDTLNLSGIGLGELDTGSDGYLTKNNKSAAYSSSTGGA